MTNIHAIILQELFFQKENNGIKADDIANALDNLSDKVFYVENADAIECLNNYEVKNLLVRCDIDVERLKTDIIYKLISTIYGDLCVINLNLGSMHLNMN